MGTDCTKNFRIFPAQNKQASSDTLKKYIRIQAFAC